MRKFLLLTIACAAALGGALYAQSVTGQWQGTLTGQAGAMLRIVMQLAPGDGTAVKVTMYSIDQGGQSFSAASATFQNSILKVSLPALGGSYEGRLSADGNSFTGTWTQGASTPLNLVRATSSTAWAIPEPAPPPKPMVADDKDLNFEVATIKPSTPGAQGQSILVGRGGSNVFTTTNTTLTDLIALAYGVHAKQISGGPGWMATEKYDITAKPEQPGVPNINQLKTMVKKLLVERFALTFHTEKKELSVYTITVASGGPKLSKNDTGGILPGFGGRGPASVGVRNSNMAEFADFLQSRILDRPVVDQTGLSGKFDFQLEWRPDPTLTGAAGANPPQLPPELESRPDLFKAVQEQLGLKLEPTKAPVDAFVIDKVQPPSEN